jgi:hypothetical protein
MRATVVVCHHPRTKRRAAGEEVGVSDDQHVIRIEYCSV